MKKVKILFVCMGNICRSPTAEGVFADLVSRTGFDQHVISDSAGTHAYHIGEPPDERARAAALKRGVDMSGQRARRVCAEDFLEFDYVIAMDRSNYEDLQEIRPGDEGAKLALFMEYAPGVGKQDVPDPYYGGPAGFDRVLDMIEQASEGLLNELRRTHNF